MSDYVTGPYNKVKVVEAPNGVDEMTNFLVTVTQCDKQPVQCIDVLTKNPICFNFTNEFAD